jgi:hypothetical protein
MDGGTATDTTVDTADTSGDGHTGSLSTGAKAGIGAGAGAGGLLAIAGLLAFCIHKRRKEKRVDNVPEHDAPVFLGGAAGVVSAHNTPQQQHKTPVMSQSPASTYGSTMPVYAMHSQSGMQQKPELHSTPSMTHTAPAQPAYGEQGGIQPVYNEQGQYQAYRPGGGHHIYSPEMPASPVQRHSQPVSPGVTASPGPRPYGAPPQHGVYSSSQQEGDGYPPGYFR